MVVRIIKSIDNYIGSALCTILSLFSAHQNEYVTKRILMIQLWGIGETILTLPTISALRKKFSKSEIDLICTKRNCEVYYNQHINKVITIKLNPFSIVWLILKNYKKYDLVIDFEEYLNISAIIAFFTGEFRIGFSNQIRSSLYNKKVRYNDKQHVVQTHLDLVKLLDANLDTDKLIKLNYSSKDKKVIEQILKELKIKKDDFIIGFGAGAAESAKSRMWPPQNFADLTIGLAKKYKNPKIILFGTKEEKELNDNITKLIKNNEIAENVYNLAGKLALRQTFALVEKCRLFISNDTGAMHIAAAQGVKTIGLFGPNLPIRWKPYGNKNLHVYKGRICKYSPCINVHKGEVPECRFGTNNKCMKAIRVKDILKLI